MKRIDRIKQNIDRYFYEHGYSVLGGIAGGLVSSAILTAAIILSLL
jgi:hypothetical protein